MPEIKVATSGKGKDWTPEELQLLTKANNLFPVGTAKRWEVVANFINQHSQGVTGGANRTAKEVLAQAKLQGSDFSKNILKSQANQNAYDNLEHKVCTQLNYYMTLLINLAIIFFCNTHFQALAWRIFSL